MADSRRAVLIEEMGLGPVWRLRGREAEEAAEPVQAEARTTMAPASNIGAAPAARSAPAARGAGVPSSSSPSPVPMAVPSGERERAILMKSWPELQQAVAECTACGLCKTRRNTVFGVGDESAQWMIVGEAPGAEEDARGEPFVGQAGRLLDSMLAALKLGRADNVYIANVLKCRPPGNRNPEPVEVAQCSPHLVRQLELIRPKLILAMGRFAAQTLLNTEASIASLRGKLHEYKGVPVIVSYHPAYLLRNLPDKAKAWEDLVFARRTMAGLLAKAGA